MKKLINHQPGVVSRWALGLLPFVLIAIVYTLSSNARLAENPNDKLLPAPSHMLESMTRMAFEPSKRTGELLLWQDTGASLERLAIGVGLAALTGLVFGIANGAIPLLRAGFSPVVTGISLVPPMAILPILFITFGLEELAKIMLIFIGITPFLIRDLQQRTMEIPEMLAGELAVNRFTGHAFGARRQELKKTAQKMLEDVGLDHAIDKYPHELSGGMQQRLALAQALIKKPRILLLGEPFGALDPGIRKDMHALVIKLWREQQLTVFMITHDLDEGFYLGTRLWVFDKDRLDPQAPGAYGARITYDLPVGKDDRGTLEDISTRVDSTARVLGYQAPKHEIKQTKTPNSKTN